jgi:acyl-CoA reductase-like NAD-dependent aldehyde dehydrogenase
MAQFRNQAPGPFLNLCVVKDADEGLAWMAQSPSRLAAHLYTGDRALAGRFRREARADLVGINAWAGHAEGRLPFAGLGTGPGLHPALDGFTRWQVLAGDPGEETASSAQALPPGTLKTDWDGL